MRNMFLGTAAIALLAGNVHAGGLDRSNQSTMFLYDEPGEVAISLGTVQPSLTGTDNSTGTNYDVGKSYTQFSAATNIAITDQFSLGLLLDQPFGAHIKYNGTAADTLGGTGADITTDSFSILGKYQANSNFSFFGGIRVQTIEGDLNLAGSGYAANLGTAFVANDINNPAITTKILGDAAKEARAGAPGVNFGIVAAALGGAAAAGTQIGRIPVEGARIIGGGGYAANLSSSTGVGYTLGAAYEIPEIAFRAAMSYHSTIEHSGDTTETMGGVAYGTGGKTTFDTPASLNIDFQTGIAEGTLLTASARLANWGSFDVIPPELGSDLASLGDSKLYKLGLARAINDELAMSVTLSHEASGSKLVSPLAPSNGLTGITLGARYKTENLTVSAGVNYTKLGDASPAINDAAVAEFTNNSVTGFGLNVKFTF